MQDAMLVDNLFQYAVNDCKVAKSLVKIHSDYQVLLQLVKKMDRSKYTLAEAHPDISNLDLRQDCVDIGSNIKKHMVKNCERQSAMLI